MLSAYFIGEGGVAAECASEWLLAGHLILGVISDDAQLRRWASKHGIKLLSHNAQLTLDPVDFIFSVNNCKILRDDVIGWPRYASLNWHDSPLPKYAGLDACCWGLLNRETTWATTWHLMNASVDTGDIVCHTPVELREDDTAESLSERTSLAALSPSERWLRSSPPSHHGSHRNLLR
jgi:methionyl-tRNA formyltransferase